MSKELAFGIQVRDTTWRTRRLGASLLLSEHDINFLNAMRPYCTVCKRQVDNITWARKNLDKRMVLFTVKCHGASETQAMHFDELPVLMSHGVQGAVAFTTGREIQHDET